MSATKVRFKSLIVETARMSGLPRLLGPSLGGIGAIIALHRVRAASDAPFQPNRTLEVTSDFLDRTLTHLREGGIDIVGLDEMARRLTTGDVDRRFVCFTLDDGYADNYLEAFSIFKAHEAPFSIFLTSGFVDRTCYFWWLLLEDVIGNNDHVAVRIDGRTQRFPTATPKEKERAFDHLHRRFRSLSADALQAAAHHLCEDYGIDPEARCAEHAMTWDMAREIAEHGLGTIEAHTVNHPSVSLQQPDEIRDEILRGAARIAEMTGRAPRHFAYPYGDAQAVTRRDVDLVARLPFTTATTTRSDILRPDHAYDLTALPRITLNGYYQSEAYLDLALSGLPSMLSAS